MDIFAFINNTAPFNLLPDNICLALAKEAKEISYTQTRLLYEQEISLLRGIEIIVDGAFETFFYDSKREKRALQILGKGEIYGGLSILLNQRLSMRTAIVKSGTRTLFIHRKTFRAVCKHYAPFQNFFTEDFGSRMLDDDFAHFYKNPVWKDDSFSYTDQFFSKKIESVAYRPLVLADEQETAAVVARRMSEYKVSCLFVQNSAHQLIGYVTDIILRNKIIANAQPADTPVNEVMDTDIATIQTEDFVFEAVLQMFRKSARYLLVQKDGQNMGFISRNRLFAEQGQAPILFIQSIKLADDINTLSSKWKEVPKIISQLLDRGVHAGIANQIISTVSDTIATKVIEKVISEIGAPPAKFCFMVLGSEGRKEQTFKTDQDNAIIYEDKANEQRETVRKYFLNFAQKISHYLDTIGISYCTGGFMAQNPKWTHSLSHWKRNYQEWLAEAVPETVVNFTTFFDCKFLYGEKAIMDELSAFIHSELEKPMDRIYYFMARNALQYEPPLTFFRGIKTFKKNNMDVFDIKKVMTPIVDMSRMYALKHQIYELNTGGRIKALYKAKVFNEKEYQELSQSYYMLMTVRLKHQIRQIISDHSEPDNLIIMKNLSRIEILTITEIFKTIKNFQQKIRIEFTKEF